MVEEYYEAILTEVIPRFGVNNTLLRDELLGGLVNKRIKAIAYLINNLRD